MKLFHNIAEHTPNSNYNTPEEVAAQDGPISFDGVYLNVYEHRELLRGKDVILFPSGDYMGGDNTFDAGMPYEEFCDWNQVMELVEHYGCKLGWHTWSHPDLTKLSDEDALREITPIVPMSTFAYPHGKFDGRIIELVQQAGFTEAYGVFVGDDTPFQKRRQYVRWAQ